MRMAVHLRLPTQSPTRRPSSDLSLVTATRLASFDLGDGDALVTNAKTLEATGVQSLRQAAQRSDT